MPTKKKSPAMPAGRQAKAKAKKVTVKGPKPVGLVTHFYGKINVGIIKLKSPVKIGDTLKFVGKHGEFTQPLTSMQFEHQPIAKAPKGKEVGIKVKKPVQEDDLVYLA
ncbi:MAG: hypothetical protein V1908_00395 [Candidatus Peregrinibacteria bacterium]